MQGGTEALSKTVEAAPPAETERQPYDELDIEVIRALQGDMPVIPEPYAPAAARLGMNQELLLAHLHAMQERKLLRRVAAILFHRRAGFSANGMGVWKVPEERIAEIGPQDGVVPRHLALLPATHLRGLAVFGVHDGPRALEG